MIRKKRSFYKYRLNTLFQGDLLDSLKKEYPSLGAKLFCDKYNLNINTHTLRCFAAKLNIKLDQERLKERTKETKLKKDNKNTKEKISLANTKYNYEPIKEQLIIEFNKYKSARKVAQLNNLNEYALKKALHKWGFKLIRNSKYSEFSEKEKEFILLNKDKLTTKEMAKELNKSIKQIRRKIKVMNINRDWKLLQKKKTIEFNLLDNPSKRPEVREKNRKRMLEHPELWANNRLKRHKLTSLEKRVKRILEKNNISYVYDTYVKLGKRGKFPDFNISNKLVLECDGDRFHQNKVDELIRDDLFIQNGFVIIHFSEYEINNKLEEVEKCILQKLKELNIQDGRTLVI